MSISKTTFSTSGYLAVAVTIFPPLVSRGGGLQATLSAGVSVRHDDEGLEAVLEVFRLDGVVVSAVSSRYHFGGRRG